MGQFNVFVVVSLNIPINKRSNLAWFLWDRLHSIYPACVDSDIGATIFSLSVNFGDINLSRTRTRKLFTWQLQVQSYYRSGKKHIIYLFTVRRLKLRYMSTTTANAILPSHELFIESVTGCYWYLYLMNASKSTCNRISKMFIEWLMGSTLST